MPSAWQSTPLDVYEKHVELPGVGQAAAIREFLAHAIRRRLPASLLYLGCAGGNGMEAARSLRVIGLDLNPSYVAAASERFPGQQFMVCDLNVELPEFDPVELAFGALVFEYLQEPEFVLLRLARRIVPGGRLVAPLLQSADGVPAVLPSPYLPALEPLGREYHTLDPDQFTAAAARAGFRLETRTERPLPSNKRFVVLELVLR